MKNAIVFSLLVGITLATGWIAQYMEMGRNLAVLVMALAMVKFSLVALWFMELAHAHLFWKRTILFLGALFAFIFGGLALAA
jgi:hypothetical protein